MKFVVFFLQTTERITYNISEFKNFSEIDFNHFKRQKRHDTLQTVKHLLESTRKTCRQFISILKER